MHYMKSDMAQIMLVSRAGMSRPTILAPDVRTEGMSAVIPPLKADDDAPPDVIGVRKGAFEWS
jgi:hypothetical protein